jgi:dimethylargininase
LGGEEVSGMWIALTREVSPTLGACELTHLARDPIDVARARRQHVAYEEALGSLGCEVNRLPPLPDHPDAVFVEDTALVLPEVAVVLRPGATSRRGETASVAKALPAWRPTLALEGPGSVDGGDLLALGKTVYVGRSGRSDEAGAEELRRQLVPWGYRVERVALSGCLHLKSAVTQVGPETLLLNSAWVDPAPFASWQRIEVAPEEPHAANALRVGELLLYPEAYPATRRRLEAAGCRVLPLDLSELAKAEGAVTCCSLLFEA